METLIVENTLQNGTFHIQNVYINPTATSWEPMFHELGNKRTINAGDYNARSDLWDDEENPRGKLLEMWYIEKNNKFKLLNNESEHVTEYYSTLDLTFVSNALSVKCICRINYYILSDVHYGVKIT